VAITLKNVSTAVPVIRLGAAEPRAAGSWSEVEVRDRRGVVGAMYGGIMSRVAPAGMSRTARLLTADQRRQLYETTPDVRACIDSISRRISTWDWNVVPDMDPRDQGYEAAKAQADEAKKWLAAPNLDGETWQEILVKSVTDLLTDDSGVWELVTDRQGKGLLKEINVLRGAYVYPIMGVTGRIACYIQDPAGIGTYDPIQVDALVNKAKASKTAAAAPPEGTNITTVVPFLPEDIVQFRLFPNTAWPSLGMPLLESLVNEVVTLLLAADHLVLAYDADEIPPGMLVIGGLGIEATKQARADMANMRGKDSKIRLISSDTPEGMKAQWIEFRKSTKDLDFANVIKEVKRTVYRVFGVMPIEVGVTEDMPRAVGAEMVDVGQSHLLEPILELIQAKVNARVLPRILPKEYQGKIKFEFDRRARLSPEEQRSEAEGYAVLHRRGAMTTNEVRTARGLAPYGAEGDVPLIETSAGTIPLVEAVKAKHVPPPDPNATPPAGEGGSDGGGVEDEENPDGGKKNAPGDAKGKGKRAAHVHGPGCEHRAHTPTKDDLPSDWQPAGRFKGYRTVDLSTLAYNVAEYVQRVDPLYAEATLAVVRAVDASYAPGATSAEDAERAGRKANEAIDRLASRWSSDTLDLYRSTVDASTRQVRKWTGYEATREEREKRADGYHDEAMGYLSAQGGFLWTLRATVDEVLRRVTSPLARNLDGADPSVIAAINDALAGGGDVAPAGGLSAVARLAALTPTSAADEVVGALSQAFEAQAYRTANYSGALVELAHETLTETLSEQALAANSDPNRTLDEGVVEYWGEWVDVGDGATCRVCEYEGSLGFRPLASFSFNPGSQMTQCKKRCRCVVTVWLGSEVRNGTAVSLAGSSKTP
jgi:hypothetical protein